MIFSKGTVVRRQITGACRSAQALVCALARPRRAQPLQNLLDICAPLAYPELHATQPPDPTMDTRSTSNTQTHSAAYFLLEGLSEIGIGSKLLPHFQVSFCVEKKKLMICILQSIWSLRNWNVKSINTEHELINGYVLRP